MKIHNEIQGSTEWLALRANYDTASEASAMMGSGPVSRSELLRMKATGDEQEFSRWVLEVLFQKGHDIEAIARPMAEEIIGEELFPVTGSWEEEGILASLDGMTMCESILWECKQWNEEKAASVADLMIPRCDYWQVRQQLLVSDAERLLYMVTDGTPERCVHMWLLRDEVEEQNLLAGWRLFREERANYVALEVVPEVVGVAPEALPVLQVQVQGMVTASNLEAFQAHAVAVIDGINTDLSTDVQFADADKAVKWLKDVETRLEGAKEQALAQTETISALFRAIDEMKSTSKAKRLSLEKLVKARKESIRGEIYNDARQAVMDYFDELNAGFGGHAMLPALEYDIAGAMKGKRTVTSLRDAADTEVARVKIRASQVAAGIALNLEILRSGSEGFEGLFPDVSVLVLKAHDDLKMLIKVRIQDHENDLAKKAQAELERQEQELVRQAAAESEKQNPIAAAMERDGEGNGEKSEQLRGTDMHLDPGSTTEPVTAPVAEDDKVVLRAPTLTEAATVLARHYDTEVAVAIRWILTLQENTGVAHAG